VLAAVVVDAVEPTPTNDTAFGTFIVVVGGIWDVEDVFIEAEVTLTLPLRP
jgi:hypothetical protein